MISCELEVLPCRSVWLYREGVGNLGNSDSSGEETDRQRGKTQLRAYHVQS